MASAARDLRRRYKLGDWLRPHLEWVTLPSWLFSIAAHVGTLFLCILLSQTPSCRPDIQGEGGDDFRQVGIYVAEPPAAEPEEAASPPAATVTEPTAAPQPLLDAPPIPLDLPESPRLPVLAAGGVPSPGGVPAALDAAAAAPSAGASGRIPAPGKLTGGTSLFGASDRGSKFVYVIDRSWSMEGDGRGVTPMSLAKSELIASIQRLDEKQQFQIVFYNESPSVLVNDNGRFDYFFGTDSQRLDAVRQLTLVQPSGGTNHFPALQRALALAPDVIFFLTDGQEPSLSAKEIHLLGQANRGARIHCIEFGQGPPLTDGRRGSPGNWMRKLASENDGTYVYHDITRLTRP